jgi:hypothetical protein
VVVRGRQPCGQHVGQHGIHLRSFASSDDNRHPVKPPEKQSNEASMTTGIGGSSAEAELMRMSPKRKGIVPISDAERLDRIDKARRLMRE